MNELIKFSHANTFCKILYKTAEGERVSEPRKTKARAKWRKELAKPKEAPTTMKIGGAHYLLCIYYTYI